MTKGSELGSEPPPSWQESRMTLWTVSRSVSVPNDSSWNYWGTYKQCEQFYTKYKQCRPWYHRKYSFYP